MGESHSPPDSLMCNDQCMIPFQFSTTLANFDENARDIGHIVDQLDDDLGIHIGGSRLRFLYFLGGHVGLMLIIMASQKQL